MKKFRSNILSIDRRLLVLSFVFTGLAIYGYLAWPSASQTTVHQIYANDRFSNRLMTFNSNAPGTFTSNIPITGLNAGEQLVGIDFRPADGLLYGVGTTGSSSRLLRINTTSGAVTAVGTGFTSPALPTSTFYGIDFDPINDQLRLVTFTDLNIRIDPNTGTVAGVDTNLAFVVGDPNFGDNPAVDMIGYDLSGTLFGIETSNPVFVRIGAVIGSNADEIERNDQSLSANTGQLRTIGPTGPPLNRSGGMKFVAIPGMPTTAECYATLNGILARINVSTGAATNVGSLPSSPSVDGIAIRPASVTPSPTPTPTPSPAPCTPASQAIVSGTDVGANTVKRFDGSLNETTSYSAFSPSFTGGVRVAVGDVDGDGIDDIVSGSGPGAMAQVRVFGGGCQPAIRDFTPYTGFSGGIFVASGDFNGDGKADIVTGTDSGTTAEVRVFDSTTLLMIRNFQPYGGFSGGVRVASGDVNGDGAADLMVAAGVGKGPRVVIYDGSTNAVIRDFSAFDSSFTGGIYIAAGDVSGDGRSDVIVGSGPGLPPQVKVFDGSSGALIKSFSAFDPAYQGGVRVGAGRVNMDTYPDIVFAGGVFVGSPDGFAILAPQDGGTQVKVFDVVSNTVIRDFLAYPSALTTGVFVSAPPIRNPSPATISGRVTTPSGQGLRNAIVNIIDPLGNRKSATTSSFGIYSFEGVRSGETHIVSVSSKRYRFAAQTLPVNTNLTNIDFVGLE